MEVVLNFGGFYGSIHEDLIDRMEESYMGDDRGNFPDDYLENSSVRWGDLKNEYCKAYVDFINEALDVKLTYKEIDSPRFYNYTTDKIICEASEADITRIIKHVNPEDLAQRVKTMTTFVDGYIPYFEFDEVYKDENVDILCQCAFDVLFEDELDTNAWLDYYDRQSLYELIFRDDYITYSGDYEIDENGLWAQKETLCY